MATVPLRAGRHVLGVRVDSATTHRAVQTAFGQRILTDADECPPNLSLRLAPPDRDRPAGLCLLFDGCTRVLRTRSPLRALRALGHHLEMADVRAAGRQVLIDATILAVDGRAHVLPAWLRRWVADDERRWSRAGCVLIDRPWVTLEIAGPAVVVDEPDVPVDAVPEDLRVAFDDGTEAPEARIGRFPLASWTPELTEAGAADRVLAAAGQILDPTSHDLPALIEALARSLPQLDTHAGVTGLDDLRRRLQAG